MSISNRSVELPTNYCIVKAATNICASIGKHKPFTLNADSAKLKLVIIVILILLGIRIE